MKWKEKKAPDLAAMVETLRARAQEHREKAHALEQAAQIMETLGGPPAASAPLRLVSVKTRRVAKATKKTAKKKAAAPVKAKAPAAASARVHKLRAPHAPDEPRKLSGAPPRGAGLIQQTCETDGARVALLDNLKAQGLVRASGRLVPGTYDVVWKDGVAIVYWRLTPLEKAS